MSAKYWLLHIIPAIMNSLVFH